MSASAVQVQGVDDGYRDVATAWRIWTTRADDPTALTPPFLATDFRLTHDTIVAWCPEDHQPPGIGCVCGIYAVENLLDGLYRLRIMSFDVRTGALWNSRPYPPNTIPVLTRGLAVRVRNVDTSLGAGRISLPELRAGAYRVEQIFIAPDACSHWLAGHRFTCKTCPDPARIAGALADALGVHAVPNLPPYSFDDWRAKPEHLGDGQSTWGKPFSVPGVPFTAPAPEPGQLIPGECVCAQDLKDVPHRPPLRKIFAPKHQTQEGVTK